MRSRLTAFALSSLLAAVAGAAAGAELAADLIVSDAKIYTQDAHHSTAEALAIRGGKIIFVGSATGAQRLAGPQTRLEKLGGRLVLPGLIDSHIHPLDILDLDVCNLERKPMPLKALAAFVAACADHSDRVSLHYNGPRPRLRSQELSNGFNHHALRRGNHCLDVWQQFFRGPR
jgi:hypothetical protein